MARPHTFDRAGPGRKSPNMPLGMPLGMPVSKGTGRNLDDGSFFSLRDSIRLPIDAPGEDPADAGAPGMTKEEKPNHGEAGCRFQATKYTTCSKYTASS